jgi:hypothetical protein
VQIVDEEWNEQHVHGAEPGMAIANVTNSPDQQPAAENRWRKPCTRSWK